MDLNNQKELKQLIDACIKGKRKYQAILHESLYPSLMVICLRYASNQQDAEDFLHDGFLRIFDKLKTYNFNGSFEGWAKRIVINNTISLLRNKREFTVNYEITISDSINTGEDIEQILLKKELKFEVALAAIQQLSPVYRTVFNMYILEGLKHYEIAEKLGISINTSKSNYQKAKNNLIKILKKNYPELFEGA